MTATYPQRWAAALNTLALLGNVLLLLVEVTTFLDTLVRMVVAVACLRVAVILKHERAE